MKRIDKVLFDAIWDSDLRKIQFAIDEGADVDARDHWKCTPLHEAASKRNVEAVRFLIKKGADVNARNKFNNTPLGLIHSNDETSKILRESGGVI